MVAGKFGGFENFKPDIIDKEGDDRVILKILQKGSL
jgi:hypothetical protein